MMKRGKIDGRDFGRKFTDAEVRNIKEAIRRGVPHEVIAKMEGCGLTTITRIHKGLTYQHVKMPWEVKPETWNVDYKPLKAPTREQISEEELQRVMESDPVQTELARLMRLQEEVNRARGLGTDVDREAAVEKARSTGIPDAPEGADGVVDTARAYFGVQAKGQGT